MSFVKFNLHSNLLKALKDLKYDTPTPVQEQAISLVIQGKDLLGIAQTGTGKTAAFALPILHMLSDETFDPNQMNLIKALILAPTRELAIQIGESFSLYGQYLGVETGVIYGGVTPKRHIKVLKREPSILVATPGRLLDLMGQGHVNLSGVRYFVLDEADRMLDLGMIKDVKSIIGALPKNRQNLLFSATMPPEITKLTQSILKNPVTVKVASIPPKKQGIKQQVYHVDGPDKTALLLELLKDPSMSHVLVFVKTKKKADQVSKAINVTNIRSKAIHSDKNQSEREKVLALFKNKEVRVLVATDVAARGLDIDGLSHVVNMDIPSVPESYVHRIGRTGRAGLKGVAISFCSPMELGYLKGIEQLQGKSLEVVKSHPYVILGQVIAENRAAHSKEVKQKPVHKTVGPRKYYPGKRLSK